MRRVRCSRATAYRLRDNPALVRLALARNRLRDRARDPQMIASGYDRVDGEFYETEPWVTEALLAKVRFRGVVWEPAAGGGAMVNVLAGGGYEVMASDIKGDDRGCASALKLDFLAVKTLPLGVETVATNPPFGQRGQLALAFMRHAVRLTEPVGGMVAMLAKVDFDSAKTRKDLFGGPPFAGKIVLTQRPHWVEARDASPRHNFCWLIWDWRHTGPPVLLHAL